MIALLDNLTILEHQNLIRFLNGRQSVSNDKTSPALHECFHSLLNQELQPCIDRRGRFIQNQNLRIGQKSSRNRKQLLLTQRDIAGFLLHFHIVAAWQGSNKVVHISRLGRFYNFFISGL